MAIHHRKNQATAWVAVGGAKQSLKEGYGLDAGNLEALAAAHVLAGQ